MLTDINLVRQHLNIDADYHGDDEYLVALAMAAEDAVTKRLGIKRLNDILIDGATLPDSVSHSILILISTWYASREAVSSLSANKVPYTLDFLMDLNKNYRSTF